MLYKKKYLWNVAPAEIKRGSAPTIGPWLLCGWFLDGLRRGTSPDTCKAFEELGQGWGSWNSEGLQLFSARFLWAGSYPGRIHLILDKPYRSVIHLLRTELGALARARHDVGI